MSNLIQYIVQDAPEEELKKKQRAEKETISNTAFKRAFFPSRY